MQKPSNTTSRRERLKHWLSDALFTGRSAADYFSPLIQAVDPDWAPGRTLATLESVQRETADTQTLMLRPHRGWRGFQSGQHVALEISVNGRTLIRTFTIASTPAHLSKTGTIALTIKQNPEGRVTPFLHQHLRVGARIGLSAASGKFLLPESLEGALLYIAAGSGITPVMSHLRTLVEQEFPVPVTLLYYAKTQEELIFLPELLAISKACPRFKLLTATTRDSESRASFHERIKASHLEKALTKRTARQVYICGPKGFSDTATALLQESSAADAPVISEHFGGLSIQHDSQAVHEIRLQRSERLIDGSAQKSLLETAEAHGLNPQSGCRMGICHTCKCKKKEGRVRNMLTGELSDAGEEIIQLCVSTPETDLTLEL